MKWSKTAPTREHRPEIAHPSAGSTVAPPSGQNGKWRAARSRDNQRSWTCILMQYVSSGYVGGLCIHGTGCITSWKLTLKGCVSLKSFISIVGQFWYSKDVYLCFIHFFHLVAGSSQYSLLMRSSKVRKSSNLAYEAFADGTSRVPRRSRWVHP